MYATPRHPAPAFVIPAVQRRVVHESGRLTGYGTTHGMSTQVTAERRSASYPLSHLPSLVATLGTLPPSPSADMIRDT